MHKYIHILLKESVLATALAVVLLMPGSPGSKPAGKDSDWKVSAFLNGEHRFIAGDYLAARFAERNADPASAADFYIAALAQDNSNRELLERTSTLLAFSGEFVRASQLAERLTRETGAGKTRSLAQLIAALPALRDGDCARVQRGLGDRPGDPAVTDGLAGTALMPLKAWCESAAGNQAQADTLLALVPDSKDKIFGTYQRVLMHASRGEKAQALELLNGMSFTGQPHRLVDTALYLYRLYGETAKANALLASFQSQEKEYRYQEPAFARAQTSQAKLGAGMAEALFEMGASAFQDDAFEEGAIFMRMALFLDPAFDDARLLLAHMLEQLKLNEQALDAYRSIPASSRFYWQARLASAAALNHLGRAQEARALLEQLATERTRDHDALLLLGDILLSGNAFGDAANTYSRALERIGNVSADDWPVYYARGICYEQAGQWDKAEPDFLKALELSPNQPSVLNYLGYSWLMLDKNVEKAEAMLRVAVAKEPGDAHILDSYGWALYKLGLYNESLIFLERAVMLMPDDSTTNDHLGDSYWRMGRTTEAKFQWRKALAFDPQTKNKAAIQIKLEQGLGPVTPLALAE